MATILIVDDLRANREFLSTLLGHHGHHPIEASNGSEALAAVAAERPDLVITDVLMPEIDGYELVRRLHLDPATRATPVVFYTAHYGAREARALAASSGVAYVLTKPAESEAVLAVVRRALSGATEAGTPSGSSPLTPEFDREHLRLVTDKLSEKAGDLRSANARLRALINIGLELASERDSQRLLQSVCVAARDLFGATYVTVGILDRHDRTVRHFLVYGNDGTCQARGAGWIKIGDAVLGMLQTVVDDRRTMRGDNPGGDPVLLGLPTGHPSVHAYVAAPVASPAHVYGMLCLVGNEGRSFTDDDAQLLTALAGQVGRIYENGYLYAVAQKRADALELEVAERERIEAARRVAAEALRITEERMRFALEAARVGIWDLDYATGALTWSTTIESQYGLEPGSFGGTYDAFIELIHPDDRASVRTSMEAAKRSGSDFSLAHRAVWRDGTVRWLNGAGRIHLDDRGNPARGVGISLDVTERRILEEQYQQAQKMEAIGRLAGGVAHDFNNLLTAILGYCELLLCDIGASDPRCADIEEIQKAGVSAAALTRQLLAFSRKEIIEPTLLDLNSIVTDLTGILGRLIREDVTIRVNLGSDLGSVKADRGQVEQIIMNLAVNGRDAMLAGGTLTIETAAVKLDERDAGTDRSVMAGSYVALTVSDTGTGMTPQAQVRLFEPFYTTKQPGKGTGLGLSTVHGIVTRCGGRISVHSEVGRGTSIKVYFPVAPAQKADLARVPPPPPPLPGPRTVLVVEDEAGLRQLVKRLLVRQGYTVLSAGHAEEALRLSEAHPSIDVLLSDVVLPGISGPELARELLARHPGLQVVYMSGYTEDAIIHHGVLHHGIAFLHKPFTSHALGLKIREVLDRPVIR